MKRIAWLGFLLTAALLYACSDDTPRLDEQGRSVEGTPEADIEVASPTFNILNILRATRNHVRVTGKVSRPDFENAKGNSLLVNEGVELEVYEFTSKEELETLAATISPDGTAIKGERVTWPATPHFYKTDRVIIIYFGADADNARQLESAFGPQFAGGR